MAEIQFIVLPFARDAKGALVPLEGTEESGPEMAVVRAKELAAQHVGSVAFSRPAVDASGVPASPMILATFGQVDLMALVR